MEKQKDKPYTIRKDILDDLSSRFVINIPHEERGDVIRICFQMELAYWFYLDFYCTQDESLFKAGLKEFFFQMFHHIPSLTHFARKIDTVLDDWRHYKQSVPTFGAILIDKSLTQVLLVQSFFARASWGFPKGKVNQDEPPMTCAIREVLEETGFDSSHLIAEDSYLETTYNDQLTRLYLIPGVPIDFKFAPQTRGEIKACQWFPIGDLPSSRKEIKTVLINGTPVGTNAFFMIMPFIKKIKRFVQEQQKRRAQLRSKTRYKSLSDVDVPLESQGVKPYRCMDLEEAMIDKSSPHGKGAKKQLFYPGPMDNYSTTPLNVAQLLSSQPDPAPVKPAITKTKKKSTPVRPHGVERVSGILARSQPMGTQQVNNSLNTPQVNNIFYPKEWQEFRFDVDAIMKCFS
ncbi:hypothetical protein M8J76_015581 [Diaphorina citri]|nr:hypothetical protein M8J75_008221 [Diaphorina citri]KAI5722911.1 hypothetical protein M8J76_015581 [Diaphorina citri]